jgi:cytochrome bd ubiquinol oxidase subunit II
MINTLWFLVLSVMLTGYAVLDGFDLGVGTLHLWIGRTPEERRTAIKAIGPVWNGNEVWLIASGGAMVAAFPHVYAAAFSGFYLALMAALWFLILRGVALEFRHQLDNALWRDAWDVAFSVASALLAVLFGTAVGNVLRGVPLDIEGNFQGSFALLLNPFALLCGVLSLVTLALHGAAYLAIKTTGDLQARARRAILPLWGATALLFAAVAAASFVVQPGFTANFARWPLLALVPLVGAGAVAAVPLMRARASDAGVFAATSTVIAGALGSAAAGLYPRLLPGLAGSSIPALDIYNAAASPRSMGIALAVYLAGMALVITYVATVYRAWSGKVDDDTSGHY